MNFKWDEVHEVAEQLEHIDSDKLLAELDKLLGHPKFDPHGDPIPDANGKLPVTKCKRYWRKPKWEEVVEGSKCAG